MDMFDEARTIDGMIKMCSMTQAQVAKKLGVSQSYVGNKLRLLNFSDEAKERIRAAKLTERHARTLLRISDEDELYRCISAAYERGMTVCECEAMVDAVVQKKMPKLIGLAKRREGVDRFMDFLNGSVENLARIGVDVRKTVSFEGGRRYVTISIDEN